ncbi:MAG: hypothetical protein RLZZ416_17 [Candidatus Parcubacteria bacterium]|jgi:CRISPR/Cas system-associated endoribonuclease Cas2
MSKLLSGVFVGYISRNKRRVRLVETKCKDFGLSPVLKTLHVGMLYPDEIRQLEAKLRKILTGAHDRLYTMKICTECAKPWLARQNNTPYELIQFK